MFSRKRVFRVEWLFAFAYALPPKVLESAYGPADAAHFPVHQAQKVETITTQPVFHGGIAVSKDKRRLLVLSPDATQFTEIPISDTMALVKNQRKRALTAEARELLGGAKTEVGAFRVEADHLAYKPEAKMPGPLWEVLLGFSPLGVGISAGDGSVSGWGAHPPWLFVLPPNRRYLHKVKWAQDSEPVSFLPCDARTSVLVENLSTGLSRIFFFDGALPKYSSLFDFSVDKKLSDASAAASVSCNDHFVAGSFGVVRVRYQK